MALVPVYHTPEANAELTFYSGEIGIAGLPSVRATGDLSMQWMPSPRVTFEGRTLAGSLDLGRHRVRLPEQGPPGIGHVISVNGDEFRWMADTGPGIGAGPVSSLLFHVLNFPWLMGRTITPSSDTSSFWSGRLHLDSPHWEITLDPVKDLSSPSSALRQSLVATG